MSSRWPRRDHLGQQPQRFEPDGSMYDDEHYDRQSERATTWPKPSSSHDRSRTPSRREPDWDAQTKGYGLGHDDSREDFGMQIRGRATFPGRYKPEEYRDRDRDDYTSRRYSSGSCGSGRRRSRSRSHSPRNHPRSPRQSGQPSREMMLDGLPPSMDEQDIAHGMETQYQVGKLEDIRIIRDRRSGESRGFGFIRFSSLEESKAFLESHFPHLRLQVRKPTDGGDRNVQIRIAYSREREERPRVGDGDWTCALCSTLNFSSRELCFKCNSPPIDMAAYQAQAQQQEYLNSGDSDAAIQGPSSQFLLIRGLEPNVTEELLAKGVSKLLKPSQSQTLPAKKAKVASTTDDTNLGARDGSIRRVLLVRDRHTDETWRYGFAEFATVDDATAAMTRYAALDKFTISSKPVSVSYIHTGVFVPAFEAAEHRFVFSPIGNSATKLRYWNEHAYISEFTVTSPEEDTAAVEASKAKLATDLAVAAAHKEGLVPVSEEQEARMKKRKAEAKEKEAKSKKTTPAHLQFWSNRHAELHGIKNKTNADGSGSNDGPAPPSESSASREVSRQSFADPKKMCCYLCSRQFKSTAEVNKHERLSELHRNNLNDEDIRKKGLAKLEKAGLPIVTAALPDEESSEYRDRARERRQAFGTSNKMSLPMKKQKPEERKEEVIKEPAASAAPSKGAALLGKMGWTAGEGLGARGEGRSEAIATNVYAAGVGLGAEGGKLGDAVEEAARNSRGDYKDFLQKTKDKAKARYDSMS